MSRVNVPLSEYYYEVSGEPSGADNSIAALIILFVGPVVRYTERFVQDKVRDIPLNVPEMRNYLSNQLFRENYPLVDKANMTGHYIEKSEYVHILVEMFSITWTGDPELRSMHLALPQETP